MLEEVELSTDRYGNIQHIGSAQRGDGYGYVLGIRGTEFDGKPMLVFMDVTKVDLAKMVEFFQNLIKTM